MNCFLQKQYSEWWKRALLSHLNGLSGAVLSLTRSEKMVGQEDAEGSALATTGRVPGLLRALCTYRSWRTDALRAGWEGEAWEGGEKPPQDQRAKVKMPFFNTAQNCHLVFSIDILPQHICLTSSFQHIIFFSLLVRLSRSKSDLRKEKTKKNKGSSSLQPIRDILNRVCYFSVILSRSSSIAVYPVLFSLWLVLESFRKAQDWLYCSLEPVEL